MVLHFHLKRREVRERIDTAGAQHDEPASGGLAEL
jgi:hypothetical protein